MILYHFMSRHHLLGIAKFGLTVGDVPTDFKRGRVGVWLTNSPTPDEHGLGGSRSDKTRFRLSVTIADDAPMLHKWTVWSKSNCNPAMLAGLHEAAKNFESWFVYFGVIEPTAITACHDMQTGEAVPDWKSLPEMPSDTPGVPKWRRQAWHANLLKKVKRELIKHSKTTTL